MRSIQLTLFVIGLLVATLMVGCAQTPPATAVPTAAAIAEETAPTTEPTAVPATATTIPTPEPTAVPPTAIPEPTATPTPEPTIATLQPLTEPLPTGPLSIRLTPVVEGFTAPVALAAATDESGRLFVADQTGRIYVVTIRPRILDDPYLDIRSKLVPLQTESESETRGLLGLALHPNFAENGRFYVHYSAPLRPDGPEGWDHTSTISEFRAVKPDRDTIDPNSERIILEVDMPQASNNGGQIAFGPDGYLYISLGDGGVSANAQDTNTLPGSVLRLDVDGTSEGAAYAIPADNPFVGQSGQDEIFAYGFRNPTQIAFDEAGRLLVADSGQEAWQEMNVVAAGSNYGWPLQDGGQCAALLSSPEVAGALPMNNAATDCELEDESLLQPVITYANYTLPNGLGTAVIGGSVYQGRSMPMFQDHYIFGDKGESLEAGGRLFAAIASQPDQTSWDVQELTIWGQENGRMPTYLRAIARDTYGEIYVLTSDQTTLTGRTGRLYKIAPEIIAESRLVENVADYLPLRQQYARMFDSAPIYKTLEDVAANNPMGMHGGGHVWVTVYELEQVNGRDYRRIFWDWLNYAWVDASALRYTSPMSRLQGIELEPGDLTNQQIAMAYLPVWIRSEPGVMEDTTIAGYLEPWDLVTIYEATEVDGDIWYRIGPDQWVHEGYVRLFYEREERPEGVGPGEKWIHVNVAEQTVIAYEGDTPIYATLSATGRRLYPTWPGLYQIYAKVRAGPMRWNDSTPPYNLANVPWIMYFNQDQALHASYWHDLFGTVRSAGCVNLSPHDAYWLFHWADPVYEEGSKVTNANDENPGTWVFVEN
jgi:glucose/arabinose dehydrogenase